MNRKISRTQMVEIKLRKIRQALILVRVTLGILLTERKISSNNDKKKNNNNNDDNDDESNNDSTFPKLVFYNYE